MVAEKPYVVGIDVEAWTLQFPCTTRVILSYLAEPMRFFVPYHQILVVEYLVEFKVS